MDCDGCWFGGCLRLRLLGLELHVRVHLDLQLGLCLQSWSGGHLGQGFAPAFRHARVRSAGHPNVPVAVEIERDIDNAAAWSKADWNVEPEELGMNRRRIAEAAVVAAAVAEPGGSIAMPEGNVAVGMDTVPEWLHGEATAPDCNKLLTGKTLSCGWLQV